MTDAPRDVWTIAEAEYKRGLEDAAKIADYREDPDDSPPINMWFEGYREACTSIAAAIRAKIQESE